MSEIGGSLRPWLMVVLSLYLASTIVFCACPPDWQEINNSCFKVYNVMKKWSEASKECSLAKQGAHLIYFDNGRPLTFVNSLNDMEHEEYFVGAKTNSLGLLVWGNGAEVSISSLLGAVGGNKYLLFKKWDLTWAATDENHESYFICELNETPTPGSSSVISNSIVPSSSSPSFLSSSSSSPTSSSSSSPLLPSKLSVSSSPSPSSSTTSSSTTSDLYHHYYQRKHFRHHHSFHQYLY
ncbi:snaclec rhodocetin subunit alpha-like [Actinia tenebrosa]|uniref:Snaclec rhodocetin subunit alpha-like n=1 Tax=Actinia tenebrosa TaxID=6105 RepID=A0A6P8HQX6_ACTTE|nr:snaclec rhodocetin subunit alpha-like [Actinia tenebrosa]